MILCPTIMAISRKTAYFHLSKENSMSLLSCQGKLLPIAYKLLVITYFPKLPFQILSATAIAHSQKRIHEQEIKRVTCK